MLKVSVELFIVLLDGILAWPLSSCSNLTKFTVKEPTTKVLNKELSINLSDVDITTSLKSFRLERKICIIPVTQEMYPWMSQCCAPNYGCSSEYSVNNKTL